MMDGAEQDATGRGRAGINVKDDGRRPRRCRWATTDESAVSSASQCVSALTKTRDIYRR